MSEYVPPPCEFEPDKLIVRMDITVRAELGSISAIVQPILSITSAMKCAEGKEFQVLLSDKTYSEQGRGIYLINQLMDRVRCERGGTEFHMRKD